MKTLIITLFLLLASSSYSQQWQKFTSYDLGFANNTTLVTRDGLDGNSRHFRINPYTNLPWMASTINIRTLSSTGEAIRYWVTNEPSFNSTSSFVGFEFMENKVVALDAHYGLKLFENDAWSSVFSSNFCNSMILHNDTIYLLRNNLNAIKWANGISESITNFGTAKRLLIQDNRYWLTSGYAQYGLDFYENGSFGYYDIDTCLLMDYGNYDFKFSPHTDTLYISGEKGLSMLHNNTFFDSIAPDNTTNMPSGKIIDFEFDANDNIWALFGSDIDTPTSIAHYNQATKNWDANYDSGNSDLNMSSYGSIELDTLGNVWFAGNRYLYVLPLNILPAWLSISKIERENAFTLFPNPSKNSITITSKNSEQIDKVVFYNAVGMECLAVPFTATLNLSNLSEGFYHVRLLNSNNENIGTLKLIVE